MRIISGQAGGIPLLVPKSLTRPTTDRVREAIFSTLGDRVVGARVLDLYAGSGALGIEALSRGAEAVTFVDHHAAACDTVRANLAKTRLSGGEVLCQPVRPFLERRFGGGAEEKRETAGVELIFADPPYARDAERRAEVDALLKAPALRAALAENGVLILESSARVELLDAEAGAIWEVAGERCYGDTRVSYLKRRGEGEVSP